MYQNLRLNIMIEKFTIFKNNFDKMNKIFNILII